MRVSKAVLVLAMCLLALPMGTTAAELNLGPDDSVASVLAAQVGQKVTVRLRAGQDYTGVVRKVNGKAVHLGALASQEFFDAVVALKAIDAVVVRVRDK
jgi:hypothetical protein